MSMLFLIIGVALMLIGGLWILFNAFKESILWGLGCIIFNLLSLVFVATHWQDNKKPFFIQIGGLAFVILAIVTGDSSH